MICIKVLKLMLRHKFIIIGISFLVCTQVVAQEEDLLKLTKDIRKDIKWTDYRIIKAIEKSQKSILSKINSSRRKSNKGDVKTAEIIAQIQEVKDIVSTPDELPNEFGSHLNKLSTQQERLYILILGLIALVFVMFLFFLIYLKVLNKKLIPREPTFKDELIGTMNKIEKNLRVTPSVFKNKLSSTEVSGGSSRKLSVQNTGIASESSPKNKKFQIIISKVSELRESGCTQDEIARKLGLGKGEVEFILNLHSKGYKGTLQEEEVNPEKNTGKEYLA